MGQLINHFKNEFLSGKNTAELQAYAERATHDLGFDYFIFRMIPPPYQNQANGNVLTNIPPTIMALHEHISLAWDNLLIKHCRMSILPITWGAEAFGDNPELWALIQKNGVNHGWSQALHDHTGVTSLITVLRAGKAISDQDLVDKGGHVMWLCTQLHTFFMNKRPPNFNFQNTPHKVTAREREILNLYGQGKTAVEIGIILTLSSRTVNFHLSSIYRKLGVSTAKQALVLAAKTGLI